MEYVHGSTWSGGGWVPTATARQPVRPLRRAKNVVAKGAGWDVSGKRRKYHRLYVYDNIIHDGERYLPQYATTLDVLKTSPSGIGPFTAGPDSEPLLDFPFWLPRIGMGGWEKINPWWEPSDENFKLVFGMIARNSDRVPGAYVPHTLVLHVKFVRYGGSETDSKVTIKSAYVG